MLVVIDALVRRRVPLSAVWVYDFAHQEGEGWNITYRNGRRAVLPAISAANTTFRTEGCLTR
ncbi:MAG: hypothetical protein FJ202_10175 [Gemmatimonadetes bacterium]|nr:hypothetical protein [Gemmatimonadota bacterium]